MEHDPKIDPPPYYGNPQPMPAAYTPYPINPMPPQVVIAQPTAQFGSQPARMICPHCQANIMTRVELSPSLMTHLMAVLLCSISCCCLPYLIDSCNSTQHNCPSCNNYLGRDSQGC